MGFQDACRDCSAKLSNLYRQSAALPTMERCRLLLEALDAFMLDHSADCSGADEAGRFFRSFRGHLERLAGEPTAGMAGADAEALILEHIAAMASSQGRRVLCSTDQSARPTRLGEPPAPSARPQARIAVTVLVVEDDPSAARRLCDRFAPYCRALPDFEITVVTHVPATDQEGQVAETRSEFRRRLLERVGCGRAGRSEQALTRLQAVVMDYTMDRFAGDEAERGDEEVSGITLARDLRRVRPGLTVFLLTATNPLEVVEEDDEAFDRLFWKHDDAELDELFRGLLERLRDKYETPFWDSLREFAARPVVTFHAMALAHGRSARKSPVLDDFLEFYGANYFLAETSATIDPLDSLLHPTGSILKAQEKAARAFGSMQTHFVTNGTSTANKIVLGALLKPGDKVLVDRNCHISHHYGIALCHARPYYLEPYHVEEYGISGGVPLEHIQAELRRHVELHRRDPADSPLPKALLLTNSTFDGIVCSPADVIEAVRRALAENGMEQKLRELAFVFDEAWFAYARFHPRFTARTAMGAAAALCERDEFYRRNLRVYATQSTHKTLSAFRQGSMIHVWDPILEQHGDARMRLEQARLTHTTTSPHSGLIASLDVARRQVELEGCALVQGAIELADQFRRDFAGAERPGPQMPGPSWRRAAERFHVVPEEELVPEPYKDQFILDTTKITVHCGEGLCGADLKAALLDRHDVQINKYSENTVLLMVNAGATLSGMCALKDALIDLSREIEALLRRDAAEGRRSWRSAERYPLPPFSGFWEGEVAPGGADRQPGQRHDMAFFFHNRAGWPTRWLPLAGAEGRVSATFVSPYPPGYPVLVPGQVISKETVQFLDSLHAGEIHGMGFDEHTRVRSVRVYAGMSSPAPGQDSTGASGGS
jgi:arginine decarboxylase